MIEKCKFRLYLFFLFYYFLLLLFIQYNFFNIIIIASSDKADETLVRPLPWLPFLVLIMLLRQIRIWLSLAALLIGDGPVTANSLVYFIQTRRRKLRSIRMHGLKAMQQREEERKALLCEHDNSLVMRLGKLLTTAMCRPRIHCEPAGVVFSPQNPAMRELLRVCIITLLS